MKKLSEDEKQIYLDYIEVLVGEVFDRAWQRGTVINMPQMGITKAEKEAREALENLIKSL